MTYYRNLVACPVCEGPVDVDDFQSVRIPSSGAHLHRECFRESDEAATCASCEESLFREPMTDDGTGKQRHPACHADYLSDRNEEALDRSMDR